MQGVRNVSFSKNFVYVLNGWPLLPFCLSHFTSLISAYFFDILNANLLFFPSSNNLLTKHELTLHWCSFVYHNFQARYFPSLLPARFLHCLPENQKQKKLAFQSFKIKQFWKIKNKKSNNFIWKIFPTGIHKFNVNKAEVY